MFNSRIYDDIIVTRLINGFGKRAALEYAYQAVRQMHILNDAEGLDLWAGVCVNLEVKVADLIRPVGSTIH